MERITTANPRLARIVRHAAFLGSIIVLYFLIWGGLFYWMNDIESLDDDFGLPLLILSGFLIGLGAELLPTHRFWGGFFASAIFGVLVILWTSDERIVINIAAVVATFSFGLMGGIPVSVVVLGWKIFRQEPPQLVKKSRFTRPPRRNHRMPTPDFPRSLL